MPYPASQAARPFLSIFSPLRPATHHAVQALQRRGSITDPKAEKQVVALLSTPLDKYDVVTGEHSMHDMHSMALMPSTPRCLARCA